MSSTGCASPFIPQVPFENIPDSPLLWVVRYRLEGKAIVLSILWLSLYAYCDSERATLVLELAASQSSSYWPENCSWVRTIWQWIPWYFLISTLIRPLRIRPAPLRVAGIRLYLYLEMLSYWPGSPWFKRLSRSKGPIGNQLATQPIGWLCFLFCETVNGLEWRSSSSGDVLIGLAKSNKKFLRKMPLEINWLPGRLAGYDFYFRKQLKIN